MAIVVRYPGRACLLGEHCDWAGGASLAVPLPLAVQVRATPAAPGEGVSIRTELDGTSREGRWDCEGGVDPHGGALRFVPAAARALAEGGTVVPPTRLEVTSDLPSGRGFSSSAAFTLAVLDALARRAGSKLHFEELAELAFHVEHDLLGVRCGRLDQLACGAATPLFIRWHDGIGESRRVRPGTTFHFVVGAFAAPRDTARILADLHEAFHHGGDSSGAPSRATEGTRVAFSTFAKAAERGAEALEGGRPHDLGSVMREAQAAYEDHLEPHLPSLRAPALRRICAALLSRGALGAKFSGAGGDGSVVALLPSRPAALAAVETLAPAAEIAAFYCPVVPSATLG